MGFFVRLRLRDARWALTPPFHPYPAPSSPTPAPLSGSIRTPDRFQAKSESGAGWSWMRLLPEGFFPHSRENRAGNPSPLLCLAPHGVFRAAPLARRPVGSHPAFSPLPSTTFRFKNSTRSLATPESGAGRYIFCDTLRHPGFASRMPPISRGMLPYGVRTFLWQNKRQASDHPPRFG